MEVLSRFSPDLDVISVDEAILEVTHCRLAFGGPGRLRAHCRPVCKASWA